VVHGYADAAEVAGRPVTELIYLAVLLVTAGADLAVFDQVVSLAMANLQPWIIALTVAGFTSGALTLAHFAGRLARDRAAGYGPTGRRVIWFLVVPWALLGTVAFIVRLIFATNHSTLGTTVSGSTEQTQKVSSAVMFLVLYVVSGVVAGFGEYLTRNPLRARYRTALRAHVRAHRRLRRSQPPYERAVAVLQLHTRGRGREEQNYHAAEALHLAFADELKRYAAHQIAAHLQDPAATDGMTLPDRRPLASQAASALNGETDDDTA
jgi:hypothetical protein